MQTLETDVAILGAGTAGMGAYKAAKKAGKQALIIEGGPYGTTCARVGCMPSKLLIAAAEANHDLTKLATYGFSYQGGYQVDRQAVMQRLRQERDRFAQAAARQVEQWPDADRLHGYARFISPNQVQTDTGYQVKAQAFVLATGSSPFVPPPLLAAGERLLTNESLFELTELPKSVAVFGAGVIGLELGQALGRLGVRVTLFGIDGQLGPLQDPKLQTLAHQLFAEEMHLQTHSQLLEVNLRDTGVQLHYLDNQGVAQHDEFEYVLAATGRRPNLQQLNLEAADLALTERGQPEHDPLSGQTYFNNKAPAPIFIAGDVSNYRPLLHEAFAEGQLAGHNAANWPAVEHQPRQPALAIVFSDPQMATVGDSLPQLQQQFGAAALAIGEADLTHQGRARILQVNKGMIRVYAEKASGQFLGAELLGPAAEHLAHLLAWARKQELTLAELLQMPYYHPVIEESLKGALGSAIKLTHH